MKVSLKTIPTMDTRDLNSIRFQAFVPPIIKDAVDKELQRRGKIGEFIVEVPADHVKR